MKHTQTTLRVGEKCATDIYADRAGHAVARTVNPRQQERMRQTPAALSLVGMLAKQCRPRTLKSLQKLETA